MSDTPRTDAHMMGGSYSFDVEFARQLERELNASKQAPTDNDTWNSLLESRARLEMELHGAKDCLDSILEVIPEDAPCQVIATGETVADYILGLQREVEKVHKLYFETQARVEKWESELSSVMSPNFKDWWQNSEAEWPEVAKRVILSLREREEFAHTSLNVKHDALKESLAREAQLREALEYIRDVLQTEINMGNYGDDDVRRINDESIDALSTFTAKHKL